ncbi:MAG: DUF4442 domain-containing protein [Parasphingorhabdus sp.]|uniref:DUF4442 domain-containing protein n=1 Tax=Parasphingorhabdus sp. TaxID=2709688 RepID=UPI003297283E
MTPYDMIRESISQTVPFASHTGIELVSIENGIGEALLPAQDVTLNHIGSQHAGALFTLGEAASGAAMAGGFISVLMAVRPVAANASILYLKVAKGPIRAFAKLSDPAEALLHELDEVGKVQFAVEVGMRDEAETEVATMLVDWHVSKAAA